MTVLLTLVSHGPTAATRRAAFPADEPLLAEAVPQRLHSPWRGRLALTGPRLACVETAARLALSASPDEDLADLDYGRWSGLSLDSVAAAEPAALRRWQSDPEFQEHGGESRAQLSLRAGAWLGRIAKGRHVVAVTHAAVIKSVILHVLDAPDASFWHIDITPETATELRHDGRRWALRTMNCPLPG